MSCLIVGTIPVQKSFASLVLLRKILNNFSFDIQLHSLAYALGADSEPLTVGS